MKRSTLESCYFLTKSSQQSFEQNVITPRRKLLSTKLFGKSSTIKSKMRSYRYSMNEVMTILSHSLVVRFCNFEFSYLVRYYSILIERSVSSSEAAVHETVPQSVDNSRLRLAQVQFSVDRRMVYSRLVLCYKILNPIYVLV